MRGKMITAHAEVSLDDPNELVAQVARERRQMTVSGTDAQKSFTGQDIDWQSVVAVPLIAAWGLPLFTLVTATATLVLIVWGIRRGAPSAAAGTRAAAHRPKRLVNG